MLLIHRVKNPREHRDYLDREFDLRFSGGPLKTWVVSDLRSKFELQRRLLNRQGHYEDYDVLRASELWRLLLKRIQPEYRVVSPDFIRAVVQDQLKELKIELGAQAEVAIMSFMDQFASLIFHPLGNQSLEKWFEQNPESFARWGQWYKIAMMLARHIEEQKWISTRWIAAVLNRTLLENQKLHTVWNRNLIFDLGAELTQTEADLIQVLSQSFECEVVQPNPAFAGKYFSLLQPYQVLAPFKDMPSSAKANPELVAHRYSGPWAEIKHAVSQVRLWLDQGVKPECIGLFAAQIENYWPVLERYLHKEGVPCQKDVMVRLQTLPVVQNWLSWIRLKTGLVEGSDLEVALYNSEIAVTDSVRFEEFEAMFKQILDSDDLLRSPRILEKFNQSLKPHDRYSMDEFLGGTLAFWVRQGDTEILPNLLKSFIEKVPPGIVLQVSTWINLLEQLISKMEIRSRPGNTAGIQVANISEGLMFDFTHRIFLGLCESQIHSSQSAWVLPSEIHSFNQDYGFYLLDPETSRIEFDLEWASLAENSHDHYCFPATNFEGKPENPMQIWLEMRIEKQGLASIHKISRPEITRWDEIQASTVVEEKEYQKAVPVRPLKLSASSLERFRDCGFISFAEKQLGLLDLPEMDLDLDRRKKGQVFHELLEKILQPPSTLSYSESEIRGFLQDIRSRMNPNEVHEILWSALENRSVKLALRFQDEEKKYRQAFPKSKVLSLETDFNFEFEGVLFRGKIDRLDEDDRGQVLVTDYKTTGGALKSFAKWIEDNQLQLGFYSWALEKGFVEKVGARTVVGALFYVLKDFDKSKGFLTAEAANLGFSKRRATNITDADKKSHFEILETEIRQALTKMREGDFSPKPVDYKICETCRWRSLCRAEHLD